MTETTLKPSGKDVVGTVMDILMGDAQDFTYMEVDGRFVEEVNLLKLKRREADRAIKAWLSVDATNPETSFGKDAEFLYSIFVRIAVTHGFLPSDLEVVMSTEISKGGR